MIIVGARLFFVLFAFGLPAATTNADYQFGLDAYQHGDYITALKEWSSVANSPRGTVPPGILAETLFAIAMLYWTGQGVEQDTREAAGWLHRAAGMNHAGAQAKLGYLYSSGQGVPQSSFEALKWLRMAANQGDADAQYNLGVLYREEAMKWFREAAASGDAVSSEIVAQSGAGPAGVAMVVRPAGKDVTEPAVQAPTTSSITDFGEDWILRQDPAHYTIQVIALSGPEKLYVFLQQNPQWAPFAIYRQTRYEQPLWVLVQGAYADVESARAAVGKFPDGIQKRKELWIRHFNMVQGLIE